MQDCDVRFKFLSSECTVLECYVFLKAISKHLNQLCITIHCYAFASTWLPFPSLLIHHISTWQTYLDFVSAEESCVVMHYARAGFLLQVAYWWCTTSEGDTLTIFSVRFNNRKNSNITKAVWRRLKLQKRSVCLQYWVPVSRYKIVLGWRRCPKQ